MKVQVLNNNLLWATRLRRALNVLGHEAVLGTEPAVCAVAIVPLNRSDLADVVQAYRKLGSRVIGHAGHKEKPLLQSGKDAGCDLVVTNSELANKLEQILATV